MWVRETLKTIRQLWPWIITLLVVAVFVPVALLADSPQTAAVALGLIFTTLVSIATLRQSEATFEASQRPYIGATASSLTPVGSEMRFSVRLTNSGATPGRTRNEVKTVNGSAPVTTSHTETDIIFPGEEIWTGFGVVPFDSVLTLTFEYEDLMRLHTYYSQVTYRIGDESNPGESIVEKDAT